MCTHTHCGLHHMNSIRQQLNWLQFELIPHPPPTPPQNHSPPQKKNIAFSCVPAVFIALWSGSFVTSLAPYTRPGLHHLQHTVMTDGREGHFAFQIIQSPELQSGTWSTHRCCRSWQTVAQPAATGATAEIKFPVPFAGILLLTIVFVSGAIAELSERI